MMGFFGTGVATTADWIRATEGMRLTAYDPSLLSQQRSTSFCTLIRVSDAEVEMHPARRSLGEKAREEMSEFERTYPW
jgi:hypothetical protein